MITDYTDNDYPTLPFKVRASGYSTTNSNDFTFTEFNGAPGRGRPSFLNGWRYAQVQVLLKNEYEQFAWQTFYDMDYNGTSGGIQKGVMPCFIECELGGQFGKFLCLITNPEFKKSSYQGKTAVLTLSVQVRPEIIGDDGACKKEVFEAFIACGVKPSDFSSYLQGFKRLAEIDMNPINYYSYNRLVFKPNGANQYITIPKVELEFGDAVSFGLISSKDVLSENISTIISSDDGVGIFEIDEFGGIIVNSGTGTIDGVAISNGVKLPEDGKPHYIVWTCSQATNISIVNADSSLVSNGNLPIFDLDIQAASGNRSYHIDDGWNNNPVILDTLNPQSSRPELITNGGFNVDLSGWQNSSSWWIWSYGRAYHPFTSDYRDITQNIIFPRLSWELRFTSELVSGNAQVFFLDKDGILTVVTNITTGDHVIRGNNGITRVGFSRAGSGAEFYIDKVSVKEYTHGTANNFTRDGWVDVEIEIK